jgi:hypothetical protein
LLGTRLGRYRRFRAWASELGFFIRRCPKSLAAAPDPFCLIATAMVLDVNPIGSSRDRSQRLEPLVLARWRPCAGLLEAA